MLVRQNIVELPGQPRVTALVASEKISTTLLWHKKKYYICAEAE